jgi:hypothetical protein
VNAKRLTLLIASGLAASGCGVTASVLGSAQSATSNTPAGLTAARAGASAAATPAPTSPATPSVPPSPSPSSAPTPPPPPPQVIVTAAENSVSGPTFQVTLISTAGTVLASAAVPVDARWTVGAGGGAAYWVTGHELERLGAGGGVTTLATVPATQNGRVVVSPDGSEWAYSTTSQDAHGVVSNRLYRGGSAEAAQLIVQRNADPTHPSSDAPPSWQYYPISWTAHGILIERQPLGGCGCGTPFDMEMTAGYSAFIDPVTGIATPVTASDSCPLSGASADGTAACFQVSSSGGSASIDFLHNLHATAHYDLSGMTSGGAATFHGSTVAYATVPKDAGGCGGPDWRPATTLHVMDIGTGAARTVGPVGLAPDAWLNDGSILGTRTLAAANGVSTSSVVVVDPVSGHVATILSRSATVVGIA